MKKLLLLLLFSSLSAFPTGRLNLNIAVVNYDPVMENLPGSPRLHQATHWTDPTKMARDHVEWWNQASHGMVQCHIVAITNLNAWPAKSDGFRYTDESYWAIYTNGWKGGHKPDQFNYSTPFTEDVPWLLPMIENGQVDQVWMYTFPYSGSFETRMMGPGAYSCNSDGSAELGNSRLFMINFPSMERADTPMENFGHGCESVLAAWFWNSLLNYPGEVDTPYAKINDFALFTRAEANDPGNAHCGNVHFAPNSAGGYDWANSNYALSYADSWFSYPLLTNAPRLMNNAEWGMGVNHLHKNWWFQHMPQKVGLHNGHLMNWLTYYLNLNNASYPIGSDSPIVQTNVDLAGWFSFELFVPPGSTQVTFNVDSGRPVEFGLRKNALPLFNRFNWWGANNAAFDFWQTNRSAAHTITLSSSQNFNQGLTGYWYCSFGRAFDKPEKRPVDSASSYTVSAEILPKPAAIANVSVEVSAPAPNATVSGPVVPISWSPTSLPCGVRAFYLAYSANAEKGPWIDICEDYHYQLNSPYQWSVPAVTSDCARVRVIVEDVYGDRYTGYSAPFGLNTPCAPKPAGLLARIFALFGFSVR